MYDTHCHIDMYQDPTTIANATERNGIFTVAVTNLPSAYFAARPHMAFYEHLKLAVGLHPLLADHHTGREKNLFSQALEKTAYVGEIGLDFSRDGIGTKDIQIHSFRFVLEQLSATKKFVTLHSRRAEKTVLELLVEYKLYPVVFHWYSGSTSLIDDIVRHGHYFSINTAMISSKSGQQIVQRIPRHRCLTETDGPYVLRDGNPVTPADTIVIHEYLADKWKMSVNEAEVQLKSNLNAIRS